MQCAPDRRCVSSRNYFGLEPKVSMYHKTYIHSQQEHRTLYIRIYTWNLYIIFIHIDEQYIEYAWHAVSSVNVWHILVRYVAGLNSAAYVPEFQSRRDRSTRGLRLYIDHIFNILTYIYLHICIYLHMYAYVRAMCGWLDVLRSFLFLSSLVFFFFTRRTYGGGRTNLLVRVCVSFYFGFLSLVVRTAELDGGCMRLSRDHMWVLSPLILIPLRIYLCFLLTLLRSSSFSLSLSMSYASARYSRGLGHTATKSWNATCSLTKDKPMSVTRIHKFLFVCLSKHIITFEEL